MQSAAKKCDREEGPPALQLPEKAVFFIYDKHPQEETMDIRQLHYFLVLCEEMNYTRAAQRLFLSRQALRQSISALEAELCGPLFLSAHHKLTLTDRGMSLQRHATPVVEQFQQMQAALRAEIQSAQPVHIGISVALVPDYLPGLETQLDKFRQQYPHVEMRFRLLDNDAVADAVEQGELDAGLVIDLGCAAPVLARTTLRADPACLLVPRGHPFWDRESIPLADLRGQRVLLPSLRQDLFSPLWSACARAGFAPNAEIGPSFYQAYYLVQEQLCTCLTRYEPGARRELDRVRDVLLEDLPPLCVSLVQRRDYTSAYIDLLRSYLMEVLGGAASLPPRRGRPAKPFYNFPVLSSTAAKPAAPVHPAPGTQLPFAGATNFRELGGYPADEGKTVRWGQIWRGVCTARLTDPADRARLDALGLRLILDLRSTAEAQAEPDYVPDGARLVQICALCGDDGHEISFAPGDIERMMHTAREGENILYRMYRQMLFGNKAFKELFRALEAGETPILFHCSAGKDRTGVAAMLILLALGASDETICADFVQTNVCRKAEIDALLAGHAEEIAADPSKRMRFCTQAGVDPGAAPYVLQVIREACGSAEEYLAREYGLTPARRMRLRRMYLE
jgi:protein-tyrosine phosphatase